MCKFCYLRNSWFWYNFLVVYTVRNDISAALLWCSCQLYLISAISLPACVMSMMKCHRVITSENRCNMQHYVIQGSTAGGEHPQNRTVLGSFWTCCIVCVNGTVVYRQGMTARVEYGSNEQFCTFFWTNTESFFLTLLSDHGSALHGDRCVICCGAHTNVADESA